MVSEVGQGYQQNERKLWADIFLSAAIFCKHFDMVSTLMRYKNACVVFNFPSSLHKVVSSNKHRVQSTLCIKTCKVSVSFGMLSWFVKQFFLLNISQTRQCLIRVFFHKSCTLAISGCCWTLFILPFCFL